MTFAFLNAAKDAAVDGNVKRCSTSSSIVHHVSQTAASSHLGRLISLPIISVFVKLTCAFLMILREQMVDNHVIERCMGVT